MSSGRLLGFISRSGQYESPYNSDRNAAQALKFLPKSTATASGRGAGVLNIQDIGSGQVDQNNKYAPQKNIESEEAQHLQTKSNENVYHQCLGLDSIVESDFDHTRTDSLGEPEINKNFPSDGNNNGVNLMRDRPLLDSKVEQHYRPSKEVLHQFPVTTNLAPPNDSRPFLIARTGRFQSLEVNNRNGLSGLKDKDQMNKFGTEMRSDSGDSFSDVDQSDLGINGELRYEEAAHDTTPSRRHQKTLPTGDLNTCNSHVVGSRDIQKKAPSFFGDYDDETLKQMTYADLQSQSWEDIPSKKEFSYPRELTRSGTSLETKVNYYLAETNKEKNKVDGSGRKLAEAFYGQLTSKEWDEAGEIFMRKFTGLMQNLQEKRREKRELTLQFETMIQARERTVRSQTNVIQNKLQDMRTGGESLLNGSPRNLKKLKKVQKLRYRNNEEGK